MSDQFAPTNVWRQMFAGIAGLASATVWVVAWYYTKLWSLKEWADVSIFFMPLLIGVTVGCTIRLCRGEGSYGLAGFGVIITLLSGLAGSALQYKADFDHRLRQLARVAYKETYGFAQRTVSIDDEHLLHEMSGSEVAVIGRLSPYQSRRRAYDYWRLRNILHVHWIASRNIIFYGQSGTDKTILEASRVLDDSIYLDQIVTAKAKEPITDVYLEEFRDREQPFLEKLLNGKISGEDFEEAVINDINGQVGWNVFATSGFGPLIGLFMLMGSIAVFKIVRQTSPDEEF